jgi:hypothetical protein
MVAAHVRIAPLRPVAVVDPAVVRDLIYAGAAAADGIEHVRARAGPHGMDILAFVDSNDIEAAAGILHRLVEDIIGSTTLLHLWRII